jgi:GNAT superfamily N-acetyltransferase
MRIIFRQLQSGEDKAGHAVWMEAYEWLASHNIRQWLVPLPLEEFQTRTSEGRNYGLFDGPSLVAVTALSKFSDDHWTDSIGAEPRWWLGALAIRSSVRGRGIGRLTVALAGTEAAAAGATELYLDCVEGPLPKYYAALGFERCAAKTITYRSGNAFPMVLMRATLLGQTSQPPR